MSSYEMEDVWENAPEELSELRAKFTAAGVNSHISWTPTQFYDNLFRPSKPRDSIVAALLKERRLGFEVTKGQLSGDASLDDNLDFWNALLAPKSASRSGSRGSGHSDEGELTKKASWTTASFTELPDVTGDHLALDNEGKYTIGDQLTTPLPSENVKVIVATATPSENWIQKLESLLCSFFAALFESSSDSGRALMELMPREALGQVQDIFKLLLATDSKLHAELDAMMVLAEKWLLAWGEDGDTRSKALEFVNAYMTKVKEEGYKKLPVQQRLRKLGAFVAGMNSLDSGDNFDSTPKENQLSALKIIRDLRSAAANKPPSPRVKPASHFARVVASLLCDVPCDAPLRRTEVYAGKGSSTAFPSTFHSDTGFRRFVDARYGAGYSKKDVFRRHRIYKTSSAPLTSISKVKNVKCILPIYTKAYRVAIESGDGYCAKGFRQGGKLGKKGEEMMEREFKGELSSRHSYRKQGISSSNKKDRNEQSKSRARNNRRTAHRSSSYDSDETWEHDKYGKRSSRKRRKGDTNSDEGRRKNKVHRDEDSRNNTKKLKSQKSKPVKSRYDSDDEFSQTSKSRSRNDTRKSKNPRKSKSTKIRHFSDEDLRQNKSRNNVPKNTRKSRVQQNSENKSKSLKSRYDSEDEMSSRSRSRNDDARKSKSRGQQKASSSNKQQRKTYTSGDSDEDLSKSRKSKSRTGAGKRKPSNTKQLKGQSSDDDELLRQKRKINNKSIQPQNNKDAQSLTKGQKSENELRQRKSQQQRPQDQKRQSRPKLEQHLKNKPLKAQTSDEELEQMRKSRGRDRDRDDVKKSKSKASQQFQTLQKPSNNTNKQQIKNTEDVNRKIGKNNEIQKDDRRSKEVKNLQNQGSFNNKSMDKGQKNEEEMTENTKDGRGSEKRDFRNSERGQEGQEERKSNETEGSNGRGSQKQNEGWGSGKRDLIESGKVEKRGSDLRKSDKSEKRDFLETEKVDAQSSEVRKSAQDTRRSRNSQRSEKRERKSERQTDKERKSKYSRQSGGKEDDNYLEEAYESMDTETDYEDRSKSTKFKGSTRSKNKFKKNFNTSKSEPKLWSKSKSRNDIKQNDKSFKDYAGPRSRSNGQDQDSEVKQVKPTYQTFMEGDSALELEFGHPQGMDISSVWRQMQMANVPYSRGGKRDIGCPGSLWGRLPLPRDKLLGQDPPACGILTSPSKSALLQDNLIEFGDFGFEKCKQIFRDEARTKGKPRPSTAEVESKMVERVSRARKNIERETKSAKFLESESEVEEEEIFIGPRPSGMSLKPKKSKKLVRKEAKIQLVTDEALSQIKLPPLTVKNKSPAQACEPVAGCLKMALKLFKTPLRAPAIPLPENLVAHFQKKFPKYDWPMGSPAALRYYPSGQPFCVVFENGAGRVHYPHGGLAVAISAPQHQSPSRVLVVRDPFDQFYFFDKSLLADLDGDGKGSVWDENGNLKKLEYNTIGGYCQVSPSFRQNWQWNSGGQRLVVKLNRYLALKILEFGKIYLVFYGHKRGVRLNVGAGHGLNLMSVANCDEGPKPMKRLPCHTFDYARGRFLTPAGVFGLFDKFCDDKEGNDKMQTELEEQNDCYVADCECDCNL